MRDIILQELDREILIYDLKTQKAYCLNETASIVYRACDGRTTFEELKSACALTNEIIFLAVDDLRKENLIEENAGDLIPSLSRLSRREAVRKIALTSAIAAPLISSLIAPDAAQAQSSTCRTRGQFVTAPRARTGAECRSMLESQCCSRRLSILVSACRTVGGVSSCSRCEGTCA